MRSENGLYQLLYSPERMDGLPIGNIYQDQCQKDLTYSVSKGVEFYLYLIGGYEKFIGEMKEMQKQIHLHLDKLKLDTARILGSEHNLK